MSIVNKTTKSIRAITIAIPTVLISIFLHPLAALAAPVPTSSPSSKAIYEYGGELVENPTVAASTRLAIGFIIGVAVLLAVIGILFLLRRRKSK